MVKKVSGFGKGGLDSIFADSYIENVAAAATIDGPQTLRVSEIEPKPDQPRKYFDQEALEQLADSISKHGLLQPIIVRESAGGFYQIIAGERRWRASKLAGLLEVPVIIMEADALKAAEIAIIENIQRQDLNPYEEATAYQSLMVQYNLTQEQVAEKVGKSRSAVANTMRLLDSLSVRDTEALVKKLNKIYDDSQKEKPTKDELDVDYGKDFEDMVRKSTGKIIKLINKGKTNYLQIEYADNEELEELIKKIYGIDVKENA